VTAYGLTVEHLQVNIVDKPEVKPGHLLIHIKAAALNPIDQVLAQGYIKFFPTPFTLGCDMAGVVEAVGSGVLDFEVGDKVCGFTGFGENTGTLAEYCLVPEELVMRKPDAFSFGEASTIGLASLTAVVGIFKANNLPLPSRSTISNLPQPWYCLVWGASGSVGSMAVQLAKAAGFVVIGVCSPHNFQLVHSLGAKHVIDRAAPDAVEQIKRFSEGRLRLAFDAVASKETTEKSCQALSTSLDVTYSAVLHPEIPVPEHIHLHEIVVFKEFRDSLPYLAKATAELSMLLASGSVSLCLPVVFP